MKRLILPFAVAGKERLTPFTKDMEMAAVFCIVERDRKKGEGRVLKKPEETLVFIAKTCYPIWLVPWRSKTLIMDGLEFKNQLISYDVLPDVKAFNVDLQASSKSHHAYLAALSQNINYFQQFVGKEEKTVEGLIANQDFLRDLMDYLSNAEDVERIETAKAILAPMLDEYEVSASVEKLSELRELIEKEIKILGRSMTLLSKSSRAQVKALEVEVRNTEKEPNRRIAKVKPKVMRKIKRIQQQRDKEVTRISKTHDRKLRSLHQNRVRLEITLKRFSSEIERCEADIKACRDRKDEASELELSRKLDAIKKKLPFVDKQIKDSDGEIANVEDAKKIDVSKARLKPEHRIQEAMKSLNDLEAEKEAKIRMAQQEVETLKERTAEIIRQMDIMLKKKEASLNEIDNMGVQEKRRKRAIVYISVYFVCYETESGKRYVVYPPSWIGKMNIKTKLKSFFGSGKMKQLLQSRSQAIADLMDQLVDLTQQNPVFEKEITEAGIKANILRTPELRVCIKKGLTELKDEKWISENDFAILNKWV